MVDFRATSTISRSYLAAQFAEALWKATFQSEILDLGSNNSLLQPWHVSNFRVSGTIFRSEIVDLGSHNSLVCTTWHVSKFLSLKSPHPTGKPINSSWCNIVFAMAGCKYRWMVSIKLCPITGVGSTINFYAFFQARSIIKIMWPKIRFSNC